MYRQVLELSRQRARMLLSRITNRPTNRILDFAPIAFIWSIRVRNIGELNKFDHFY
jgi:hypothetical protein